MASQMSWGSADLHGSGVTVTEFGLCPTSTGVSWKGVKQGGTGSVLYFGKALSGTGRRTDGPGTSMRPRGW